MNKHMLFILNFDDVMIILMFLFNKCDTFKIFLQLILILCVKFMNDFVIINCLIFLFVTRIVAVCAFNVCRELFIVISCCVYFIVIDHVITAFFVILTKMMSLFFEFFSLFQLFCLMFA